MEIEADQLQQLYFTEQLSLREIAKRLEVSPNTVRRRMLKFGIKLRSKNTEPDWWQNEKWLRKKYVKEGLSTVKIADLVGANSRTVNYTLEKFGIKRRSAGGQLKGKKMSASSRLKMSIAGKGKRRGAKNPNWKGGKISDDVRERRSFIAKKWRSIVLERDKRQCQTCGSKEHLHVHHIKSFKKNPERRWDINNGITVCVFCHEKIHSRSFPDWLTGRKPKAGDEINLVTVNRSDPFEISREELEKYYQTKTISEIAQTVGFSDEAVRKKMIEYNINRRASGPTPNLSLDKITLERLYGRHTMRDIAKILGVGETLVHKKIHQYGIPVRSRGARPNQK